MKLKVIEPGWAGFSGNFGGVDFVDGVSVRDVTELEALRLSNLIRIETEEGTNPSSSQQVIDRQCIPMDKGMEIRGEKLPEGADPNSKIWTRTELQNIADAHGIKGLREISEPMGVKHTAISGLIDAIMAKQTPPPVVEPKSAVESEAPQAETSEPESDAQGLYGSSVQPSQFEIGGKTVPLGDIVRAAFEKSGMTVTEWNEQESPLREAMIAAEVTAQAA
jgi:hypothetical protein